MAASRPPKKNGTIEIRLPDEAKAAFMLRCREDERTASEAIRTFIDEQIALRPSGRRRRVAAWRIAAAAIIGVALGAGVAAPSLARSAQNTPAAFDRLDRNHDGMLTYQEFRSR